MKIIKLKTETVKKDFAMSKEVKHVHNASDAYYVNDENGLTVEQARKILGDKEISDEKLQEIVSAVKIFCKIAYELYASEQEQFRILDENSRIVPLTDEPGEIKEVA